MSDSMLISKRTGLILFIILGAVFYVLARIWVNPFILWTALPLYVCWVLLSNAQGTRSRLKYAEFLGFAIPSIGFSLFYHLTWFLDWQETRTGSSTSALIFVWLPIYSVLLGLAGQFIGKIVGKLRGFD